MPMKKKPGKKSAPSAKNISRTSGVSRASQISKIAPLQETIEEIPASPDAAPVHSSTSSQQPAQKGILGRLKSLFNRAVAASLDSKWIFLFFLLVFLAGAAISEILPGSLKHQLMKAFLNSVQGVLADEAAGNLASVAMGTFLKNLESALMALVLGPTIIFPIFLLLMNGGILGIMGTMLSRVSELAPNCNISSPLFIISALLPHGIFELPAVFLSCALGARVTFKFIFPKGMPRSRALLSSIKDAALGFLFLVVPLLMIAAVVETYITPAFTDATLSPACKHASTAALNQSALNLNATKYNVSLLLVLNRSDLESAGLQVSSIYAPKPEFDLGGILEDAPAYKYSFKYDVFSRAHTDRGTVLSTLTILPFKEGADAFCKNTVESLRGEVRTSQAGKELFRSCEGLPFAYQEFSVPANSSAGFSYISSSMDNRTGACNYQYKQIVYLSGNNTCESVELLSDSPQNESLISNLAVIQSEKLAKVQKLVSDLQQKKTSG